MKPKSSRYKCTVTTNAPDHIEQINLTSLSLSVATKLANSQPPKTAQIVMRIVSHQPPAQITKNVMGTRNAVTTVLIKKFWTLGLLAIVVILSLQNSVTSTPVFLIELISSQYQGVINFTIAMLRSC